MAKAPDMPSATEQSTYLQLSCPGMMEKNDVNEEEDRCLFHVDAERKTGMPCMCWC